MGFKLSTSRKATVNTVNGLNYSFINIIESRIPPVPPQLRANSINYVIVGGGGAGGTNAGSGGGAGGFSQGIINSTFYSPAGIQPNVQLIITIGGGGAAAGTVSDTVNGSPGTTSALTLIDSDPSGPGSVQTSYSGLGGGAGGSASLRANVGGVGWGSEFGGGSGGGTPSEATPLTPVPGYYGTGSSGGIGPSGSGALRTTGGGGGASQVGANGVAAPTSGSVRGGKGGDGAPTWITGSNVFFAGGGAGAVHNGTPISPAPVAQGGRGGGGAAGVGSAPGSGQTAGFQGNVNTGGGGGGGGGGGASTPNSLGGVGGSGIVIISHPAAYPNLTYTGSNVLVSNLSGNIVYQFYSSGTITF